MGLWGSFKFISTIQAMCGIVQNYGLINSCHISNLFLVISRNLIIIAISKSHVIYIIILIF